MCEMDAGEERKADLYAVLGLKKECSAAELRNAYKKLALRWHPDRCSASGSSKHVEEAKKKFQAIQEAYSVLSDADKRFLYDVGVYDCNDDDENGMGDFLNEMAAMMCQNKPNIEGWRDGWVRQGNGEDSFEELQELYEEMFQSNIESFGSTSQTATPPSCSSSLYASCGESSSATNKRSCSETNSGKEKTESSSAFHAGFEGFCFGAEHQQNPRRGRGGGGGGMPGAAGGRRRGRKQKVSFGHGVSSSIST